MLEGYFLEAVFSEYLHQKNLPEIVALPPSFAAIIRENRVDDRR